MRWLDIRRGERAALAWAAAWFFCVLAAYYTIRPVREAFATELSSAQRADLFTLTLVVMLLATPLYGIVLSWVSRRWLVPIVYGFFMVNLIAFWIFAVAETGRISLGLSSAFFVWISVFNLFVVTLFWGTIVDLFTGEQGKRLFGLLFGAGTLGQLIGSYGVQATTSQLGISGLLWVCIALLGLATICSWQLRRLMPAPHSHSLLATSDNSWRLAWQGVLAVARSGYLRGIAACIAGLSLCGTIVYFQMTDIVRAQIPDSSERIEWFAKVNTTHAVVTLVLQTAIVGGLLRTLGVGFTLALVPAVYCAGFVTLTLTQTLVAVGLFQVALRAAAFSLGNPALEVLYTAVAPEQKYRAKSFIDTVGKRSGDVLGAQVYAALASWGWLLASISLAMVPLVLGLIVLCLGLGARHHRLSVIDRSDE